MADVSFDLDACYPKSNKVRGVTPDDRKRFIKFMFDNMQIIEAKSRNDLSKKLVKQFEEETGVRISLRWVYPIVRLGPIKHSDGTYSLKYYNDHTIDELCEHPNIVFEIKFT